MTEIDCCGLGFLLSFMAIATAMGMAASLWWPFMAVLTRHFILVDFGALWCCRRIYDLSWYDWLQLPTLG